jgi:hypothetical protein
MRYVVYALIHPETKLIQHVGQSFTGLSNPRFLIRKPRGNSPLACWLRQAREAGIKCEVVLLADAKTARELEYAYAWWSRYAVMSQWCQLSPVRPRKERPDPVEASARSVWDASQNHFRELNRLARKARAEIDRTNAERDRLPDNAEELAEAANKAWKKRYSNASLATRNLMDLERFKKIELTQELARSKKK